MCGIAGELLFNDTAGPKADWDAISARMARRGPDDAGMWSDGERCTLVFRRLAIIDLSPNGHQPMTACNGRFVLVFNGEVYNFQDLRNDLEGQGVKFRSTSDSEVVLHALIQWGKKALERFNGMFALGFYDRVEKRLLLARDHAGIKPLYYLLRPEGIVFASQYNQLLAHPFSRNLGISKEALGLYLRLAYIPAPYALLENSYMLEPGTWIQFTAEGRVQKEQFYHFPQYETAMLKGHEAIDAVDAVTTAAVKRHLISDVPVGAFLSGGIDSPLVVAKMRLASSSAMEAFTIGTGDEATDETSDAMAYAREFGIEHFVETMLPAQSLDFIDDVIDSCGEPFGDYSMFPTMMVSRLASQKYKVMLSGDGGDELFWGYTDRFGPLVRRANEFKAPLWCRWIGRGFQKISGQGNSSPYFTCRSLGDLHRSMLTHLSEASLKQVFPSLAAWPTDYTAFENNSCESHSAAENSRLSEFVG
ncbi:MAG: asparagine synthase (glutamine-hydrolyzing), partial [Nitrospirae bacterium]|nr:asparagine synthase (glutamine-hydrolyzing) [Nitrospirota bacterium]